MITLRRRFLVALATGLLAVTPSCAEPDAATTGRVEPPDARAGSRLLVLVRHGEYDTADPRDAALGKALLPIGIAQARLLGARLRGEARPFDALLASPLTRARETAQVLADDLGLTLEIVPDLAECTPPTRRADVMAGERPEDLTACRTQLDRLATRLLAPSPNGNRRELVVCHGNVIRSLVVRALGVADDAWLGMSIGHASQTVLTIDPQGTPRVISVGDVGHLPPNLRTGSVLDPHRDLLVPTGK